MAATSLHAPDGPDAGGAGRPPVLPPVAPLDAGAMEAARRRWDTRAKPVGALGALEAIGVRLAGITGRCPPPVPARPVVVVFAGDHGVVDEGVSAWPSEVTALMVAAMAGGGAAVSRFAAAAGAAVEVVDVGVGADLTAVPGVLHRKVARGTANCATGPAMSIADAHRAVEVGREAVGRQLEAGADLLVAGEMGIGNTTPASCLVAHLCGAPPSEVAGPGAGLDPAGVARKRAVVARALDRVGGDADPWTVLAELGGFEIAAMAGCYAEAAHQGLPVVVDGVIALAALLVADRLAPGTADRTIAGHRPAEPAGRVALDHLGMVPLLDLGLRLGEGTGGVLAVPLVRAVASALAGMADLPG